MDGVFKMYTSLHRNLPQEDLDFLIVDITASEDVESENKKAFNKLFDLTRRYVDSRTTTTNNEN